MGCWLPRLLQEPYRAAILSEAQDLLILQNDKYSDG
jgi:hypothetical protein